MEQVISKAVEVNAVTGLVILFVYLFLQAQIGLIVWLLVQVKELFVQMVNEMRQLRETIATLQGRLGFYEHSNDEV